MRIRISQKLRRKIIFSCLIAIFTIVIGLLSAVPGRDLGTWIDAGKIGAPAIYAALVVCVAFLLIFLSLNVWSEDDNSPVKSSEEDLGSQVKNFFDSLKTRYEDRYRSKLDGRFAIPLEISESWNIGRRRPYKFDAEIKTSEAIDAVKEAFNLHRTLIIVGSPGSGKTVLLLKLAIELFPTLFQKTTKLPVIFNLNSWSEDYETFDEWLIDILNSNYGLTEEPAKKLLNDDRIIFLFDGLDELARKDDQKSATLKRAKCLESLNEYLYRGRKAVICCRREEFEGVQATTNQKVPVPAVVDILDLTKPDIILALQYAESTFENRTSVKNIEKIVETNEIFLEVLSTPFYFTTALEVFDRPLSKESILSTDANEIRKSLLDSFIQNKIYRTRDLNDFEKNVVKIKKWLKWLSNLMEKKQLIIFELTDLRTDDISKKTNLVWILVLLNGISTSILTVLISFIVFSGLNILKGVEGILIILIYGFIMGGLIGLFSYFLYPPPRRNVSEDIVYFDFYKIFTIRYWKQLLAHFLTGLLWGPIVGTVGGFVIALINSSTHTLFERLLEIQKRGAIMGLVIGMFLGTYFTILGATDNLKSVVSFAYIKAPYKRLYSHFISNLIVLIASLAIILSVTVYYMSGLKTSGVYRNINVFSYSINSYEIESVLIPVVFCLPVFLINRLLTIAILKHFILRFCIWLEGNAPLRYVTFLDLAASAGILEKDGGSWRFRHQNLQEYFTRLK